MRERKVSATQHDESDTYPTDTGQNSVPVEKGHWRQGFVQNKGAKERADRICPTKHGEQEQEKHHVKRQAVVFFHRYVEAAFPLARRARGPTVFFQALRAHGVRALFTPARVDVLFEVYAYQAFHMYL